MPELPEVETVRRGLLPTLQGRRILSVETRRADLRVPFSPGFAARLAGRRITALTRRAKYILAETDGAETLVIHLGMSGRITVSSGASAVTPGAFVHGANTGAGGLGPHDHVMFTTEDDRRIIYTDHRRFGLMLLIETAKLGEHRLFKSLGPEPLEDRFSAESLDKALAGKRTPIKSALLDQRVVAGLGNIYVCEALHRAHISPKRSAATVPGARTARLVPAIKAILNEAIEAGGSTLRDYAHTDGELGYFQHRFAVYDRLGGACGTPGCAGSIKRFVQSGRSTWYCPACQR